MTKRNGGSGGKTERIQEYSRHAAYVIYTDLEHSKLFKGGPLSDVKYSSEIQPPESLKTWGDQAGPDQIQIGYFTCISSSVCVSEYLRLLKTGSLDNAIEEFSLA